MKRFIFILVVVAGVFSSCVKSNELNIKDSSDKYSEARIEIKTLVSNTTSELMMYAMNADGSLDYEIAESVLNDIKPVEASLVSFSSPVKSDSYDISEVFSDEQMDVYNMILNMAESGCYDYNKAMELSANLTSSSDKEVMDAFIVVLDSVYTGLINATSILDTKANNENLAKFACNLATGGIGAIYGAWGSGILIGLGVVTGGVGTIVGGCNIVRCWRVFIYSLLLIQYDMKLRNATKIVLTVAIVLCLAYLEALCESGSISKLIMCLGITSAVLSCIMDYLPESYNESEKSTVRQRVNLIVILMACGLFIYLVIFSGLDESVRQTIGFITLIVVTVLLIIGSVILTRKRK